jgi:hypothetical protein
MKAARLVFAVVALALGCNETGTAGTGGTGGGGGIAGGGGVAGGGDLCAETDCDDGNECTTNTCEPSDGTCINDPVPDGTPCDFAGAPGVCSGGVCSPVSAQVFVVETIGGGVASSADHRISVSIGGPVGGGTASSANYQIELGMPTSP